MAWSAGSLHKPVGLVIGLSVYHINPHRPEPQSNSQLRFPKLRIFSKISTVSRVVFAPEEH